MGIHQNTGNNYKVSHLWRVYVRFQQVFFVDGAIAGGAMRHPDGENTVRR